MKLKKTIISLCVCTAICAVSVGAVFDKSGKDVTVKYIDRFSGDELATSYKTQHKTVEEFFVGNDISCGEFDKVSHDVDTSVVDGSEITITKAVPITILYEGKVITTVTTMPTVNGALLETGMMPGENDIVSPSGSTPITEGITITITSIKNDEAIEIEYTDFETQYKDDDTLAKGKTNIIQNGEKGQIQISYTLTYENNTLKSKEETQRVTVKEPVAKIIARGTKEEAKSTAAPKKTATPSKVSSSAKSQTASVKPAKEVSSSSVNGLNYSKKLTMTATAYSAFNSSGGYALTASGIKAKKGVVAVDKSVIPLGTRLYIEGYGEAIAADVGGAIKGNKIDLCFEDSNSNLRKFGRQKVQVYILN